MEKQKMGQFISELRKQKKMTQKQLAEKLNVTDKAVSKWERGLACPDISLLTPVADILGITTSELLNGERKEFGPEDVETSVDNALQYAEKTVTDKWKTLRSISAVSFSLLLLAGVAVCGICDMAISGSFTWSLYPISAIVFAWLVFFPVIKLGAKGIIGTMLSLSTLIVPFLYVLHLLVGDSGLLLTIGIRMAAISIVFLWGIYAVFRIFRKRKAIAAAVSLLAALPVHLIINYSLSRVIGGSFLNVWDGLSLFILAVLSLICFGWDCMRQRRDKA